MAKRVGITDKEVQAAKPGEWLWDAPLPGACSLGLRVTAAGVKTFTFRYRLKGQPQRYEKIGRYGERPGEFSLKDARIQALKWAAAVAEGKEPNGPRDAKTLSDLAEFYLREYGPHRGLKPATLKAAEIVLKSCLKRIGHKSIAEITPADIRRAHAEAKARKEPPPLTDKINATTGRRRLTRKRKAEIEARRAERSKEPTIHQANRLLTVLSKMFALAIEEGWRTDNPCSGVSKFKISRRERYFSEEEIGRLLAACDGYPNQSAANAIRLLLYTGARLNEALKAEWSQFDLERAVWVKPSAHTKTQKTHIVPLSGPVLALLKDMREEASAGRYLFPGESIVGRKGEPPEVKPRADLKRPWARICKAAGVSDARRHDLRRTTASIMASAGEDRQTIGRVLGHTQAATTDSYISIFQHAQAAAVKKAGERIQELRAAAPAGKVIPFGSGPRDETSA